MKSCLCILTGVSPLGGGILVGDQIGVISGEGQGGGVASHGGPIREHDGQTEHKCYDPDGHKDALLAEGAPKHAAKEKTDR